MFRRSSSNKKHLTLLLLPKRNLRSSLKSKWIKSRTWFNKSVISSSRAKCKCSISCIRCKSQFILIILIRMKCIRIWCTHHHHHRHRVDIHINHSNILLITTSKCRNNSNSLGMALIGSRQCGYLWISRHSFLLNMHLNLPSNEVASQKLLNLKPITRVLGWRTWDNHLLIRTCIIPMPACLDLDRGKSISQIFIWHSINWIKNSD